MRPDVRPVQRMGLRGVVELRGDLRRVGDRRVLPARPERERGHHGRHRRLERRPLAPRASSSARARAPSSATTSRTRSGSGPASTPSSGSSAREKARNGFEWAEHQLEDARLLHHRHRAVHPRRADRRDVASGYTHAMPLAALHRRRRRCAGVLWGAYAAMLGYVGGKTFEDAPWKGSSSGSSSRSASPWASRSSAGTSPGGSARAPPGRRLRTAISRTARNGESSGRHRRPSLRTR